MKKPITIIAVIAALVYLSRALFIPHLWGTTFVADILFAFSIFACVVIVGSFIKSLLR